MSLSQVKLSESSALAMMQAAHPNYVTPSQLAAAHSCSTSIARNMMHRLADKGLIEREVMKGGMTRSVYVDPADREKKAAAAKALADTYVKPFKTNVWTPPLSGYERSLRDAAARAVAGR